MLKVRQAAVLALEPVLAIREATCLAGFAFGVVGAVEEGDVLVANVAEPVRGMVSTCTTQAGQGVRIEWEERREHVPVDLALVLEEPQRDAVHRGVTPALVEEAARAIQVLKVLAVLGAAPKSQIGDLEVGPEVAGGVAVGDAVVLRPAGAVLEPGPCAVLVHVVLVVLEELERLGPQGADRLGAVVQVDVPAVRLVVVLHPAEDVVVDVAEEVHARLDAPVVLRGGERGVLAEEAAVPAAHLVVGEELHFLDVLRDEERDGFFVQVLVNPGWDVPVLGRYEVCSVLAGAPGVFTLGTVR